MAGPCLTILLPSAITEMDRVEVENIIQPISTSTEKKDFWVDGQPLLWGDRFPDEDESQLNLNGWSPKGTIYFCAMCNNIASHTILASICSKVAQKLDGMIILDNLSLLKNSTYVLKPDSHIIDDLFGYIVKPSFLNFWLNEKDFRLVK